MKNSRIALFGALLTATTLIAGCADPSDETPAAVVNEAPAEVATVEAVPAEAAPAMSAKTYTIAPTSTIAFVGSKVTGSHDGGFKEFSGTVALPGDDVTKAVIDVTITMASTFTDTEDLTVHLLSPDFFDAETFPESRFVSTGIEARDDAYLVTGNFTLHGLTKSITFPASMSLDGDTFNASAEFDINRFDFDVKYAGKADDLIRENVVIKLDINAAA